MSEQEVTTIWPDVLNEQWKAGPTIHPSAEEWFNHGYIELRGKDFSVVGYWDDAMTEDSAPKAKARARLAAAAPVLYKALDTIRWLIAQYGDEASGDWPGDILKELPEIDAALSKARGETE